MRYLEIAAVTAVVLFVTMLLLQELGHRLANRPHRDSTGGVGPVEGAVFALMGLLVAFTFSGAAARFDARRKMIVEEANNVGTAYLRIDLLPAAAQPKLRQDFRRYVESRVEVSRLAPDRVAAKKEIARATAIQQEIWAEAVAAANETGSPAVMALVVGALNPMFDIANSRVAAVQMHLPTVIFGALILLTLACALLAGFSMTRGPARNWFHGLFFAFVMTATIFVIVDLEFPRVGFIRLDSFDQVLMDVRNSMN